MDSGYLNEDQQVVSVDSKNNDDLPVLAYWNIRGNAHPIRLLLRYTRTEYRERKFNFGKYEMDKAKWRESKSNPDMDFPNLPYYVDKDVTLTQSLTILRYLARKLNMAGNNVRERIRIDMLEQQLRDYRNEFLDASNDKNFEKARLIYLARLPEKIISLSKFLGEKPFFSGNTLTYVDFMAYEFLSQHDYLDHELFKNNKCENLKDFLNRIESFPTMKEYQLSPDYIRHPSGLLVKWYEAKYFTTFHRSVSDKATEQYIQQMSRSNWIHNPPIIQQ